MLEPLKAWILHKRCSSQIRFECNICGSLNRVPLALLNREIPSCKTCFSSVRMRSIVNCLSLGLFGRPLSIQNFPESKNIVGIGLSDWEEYSTRLKQKLNYQNTFFHKEPKLDITQVSEDCYGTLDFIISTDVFEHVGRPVENAFKNSWALLKPGGVLVLSVPYTLEGNQTVEHFPVLENPRLTRSEEGTWLLEDHLQDGTLSTFSELIFHGGEGETLEMRVFSEKGLLDELKNAGFQEVKIWGDSFWEFGVHWPDQWSLPIVAKKI